MIIPQQFKKYKEPFSFKRSFLGLFEEQPNLKDIAKTHENIISNLQIDIL